MKNLHRIIQLLLNKVFEFEFEFFVGLLEVLVTDE
jgi:hypothetical protein